MADAANLRYLCKTCKAMFWSYQDVTWHKGSTGHGEYLTSPRNKPFTEAQSEA
jgi:hypothetical protein